MKYFFVLGSNPTLSAAELSAVLDLSGNESRVLSSGIFMAELVDELEANALISKIGGTIKIGKIIGEIKIKESDKILEIVKKLLPAKFDGKFKFGFSNYGVSDINLKVLGMATKKFLQDLKISSRWVTSREKTLSSVVVEQNKMIDRGVEIVFFSDKDKIFIGRTEAVQPFKELSQRDYGRPSRDDYAGMLPPKLAMMMINLTGSVKINVETQDFAYLQNVTILDAFCGSGTILTEAMLLGFQNLIGADISAKAVDDTKKNLEWTKENFKFFPQPDFGELSRTELGTKAIFNFQLFNKNALVLSEFIKPNTVDAIVTEPYLGPARGKVDFKKVKKELEDLYGRSLVEFYKVLKPGGRVVMVWPVFHGAGSMDRGTQIVERGSLLTLNIKINNFKILNPIPENLKSNNNIKLTNRNTIIYGRPRQKVWREIVVLEK